MLHLVLGLVLVKRYVCSGVRGTLLGMVSNSPSHIRVESVLDEDLLRHLLAVKSGRVETLLVWQTP